MDKKVICLFAMFLLVVLTMGSISAANLENHDFDGYFSMDVPKGSTFQLQNDSDNESGVMGLTYMSDSLGIMYMDSPFYSENSSYYLFQTMFEIANPDLTKCYESQDGNLRVLEPTNKDGIHLSLVGTCNGTKIVILMGNDTGLLKKMGHTIEFK